MNLFRAFLVAAFAALAVYTGVVISREGASLVAVFFGDIASVTWRGQFDLDFACLLALTGLWIAYRHRFRASGLLFAACAAVGGVLFLSIYLFVAALRAKGDVETLLLGENAARPSSSDR